MYSGKIAHIADIHIKNKYREFSNLFDSLHNEKPDIIVLAGDIVDSITNITPTVIMEVTSFLSSLTAIAPVIMIPGNHDISCKINDIDFFTTIVNNHKILSPPRFNYWRHSGIYEFQDIIWTVVICDEDIPNYEFNINTQILLFHEDLKRITPEMISQYTGVMAGHIHLRKKIAENAAYCGSLFQQNIKESHLNHGYLLWTFNADIVKISEIDIENNYGFLKVELIDGIDVTTLPIPNMVEYYDIYHSNTDADILNTVIKYYSEKYDKRPRNIINKNNSIESISDSEYSFLDITDINLHNILITQYLNNDNRYLDKILKLHSYYYNNYVVNYNKSKLKLLSLEFENMYNFIGKNKIDFLKMNNKLSGIISSNTTGKTSFIDIILYALYDIHPRVSTKQDIINKECSSFNVFIEFELNDIYGYIKKEMGSVVFFYNNKNLTQKTILQTLNEIKKTIGTQYNALTTSYLLQYKYNTFINSSAIIRKQKISSILALDFFSQIEEQIIKLITENTGKCNSYIPLTKETTEKINIRIKQIINEHAPVVNIDNQALFTKLLEYPPDLVKSLIAKFKQHGISYLFKISKNEVNSIDKTLVNAIKEIALILIEIEYYKIYHNVYQNIDLQHIYKELVILCRNTVDITEYEQAMEYQEILKTYRQIIKPSEGIISVFLSKYRFNIENEVNAMLTNIGITIKINDDYDIYYTTNNISWLNVSIASGYQKFIINVVFTLYLWKVSNVIIPDMFIIDEGFGTCDQASIEIITKFLLNIAHSKDFPSIIFIISHIDYLNSHIEAPLYIIDNTIVNSKQKISFAISENTGDTLENMGDTSGDTSGITSGNTSGITSGDTLESMDDTSGNTSGITSGNTSGITSGNTSGITSGDTLESMDNFYCNICNKYVKIKNKVRHLESKKHKTY